MACPFEVLLNAGQYPEGTELALDVLDLIDRFEDQLSFFRPESELSRVNREAADGPMEIDAGLFEILSRSAALNRETGGAFDITSTPLWEAWGFARRSGRVPSETEIAEALADVDAQAVRLDAEDRTVSFDRPGLRLNLGSIAKGYALDRCAEEMERRGIFDFLVHAGGSSVIARGDSRQPRPENISAAGWPVGVPHPTRPGRRLAEIWLYDAALATSGSRQQSFVHEGRRLSHILDPRTGHPAEGLLSVTVVADEAIDADAVATALFVMGPDEATQYAEERGELGVLMALPSRQAGGCETRTINLAEDRLRWL